MSRNKGATIFLPLTLTNANRFSKFFLTYLQKISSKAIMKYSTTPQMRRYTILFILFKHQRQRACSTYMPVKSITKNATLMINELRYDDDDDGDECTYNIHVR